MKEYWVNIHFWYTRQYPIHHIKHQYTYNIIHRCVVFIEHREPGWLDELGTCSWIT